MPMTPVNDGTAASAQRDDKWWRSTLRDAAATVSPREQQFPGPDWFPPAVLNASAAQRIGAGPEELRYQPAAVGEVARGFAERLSQSPYEWQQETVNQIDTGELMTTLATGDADETLTRAATVIVEASDRASGGPDRAPDPQAVAQVSSRMRYTMGQVQMGVQHAPPGDNFAHRLGLAAADEGLYAMDHVSQESLRPQRAQERAQQTTGEQQTTSGTQPGAAGRSDLGDGAATRTGAAVSSRPNAERGLRG
jgi:hypothetical protein